MPVKKVRRQRGHEVCRAEGHRHAVSAEGRDHARSVADHADVVREAGLGHEGDLTHRLEPLTHAGQTIESIVQHGVLSEGGVEHCLWGPAGLGEGLGVADPAGVDAVVLNRGQSAVGARRAVELNRVRHVLGGGPGVMGLKGHVRRRLVHERTLQGPIQAPPTPVGAQNEAGLHRVRPHLRGESIRKGSVNIGDTRAHSSLYARRTGVLEEQLIQLVPTQAQRRFREGVRRRGAIRGCQHGPIDGLSPGGPHLFQDPEPFKRRLSLGGQKLPTEFLAGIRRLLCQEHVVTAPGQLECGAAPGQAPTNHENIVGHESTEGNLTTPDRGPEP